jgi:branched-chain amino acid transport system substrate-binding protein
MAAMAATIAGCGTRPPAEEREYRAVHGTRDIVIAVAWPWSAREGFLYGQGIDLAVAEVNAAGGVNGRKLQVLRVDDRETVDEGRLVAQRLASNPDVVAVIGHLHSYVTGPAAAIYDMAGLVTISPTATDPGLTTKGYRRFFRTTFTDKEVGRQMALFAAARGSRRSAIYYVRSDYGRGLANAFEETFAQSGGVISDRQSYDPSGVVNREVLTRIGNDWRTRSLDTIFIAGEALPAAQLIAELRRQGLTIPVLAGDAAGTADLFGDAPTVVEGTIVASPFHPSDPRPAVREFVRQFTARFNTRPDAAAAVGYDAIRLIARGMEIAKSASPSQVATALHTMGEWDGVTGPVKFSDDGELGERAIVKMIARSGTFEVLPTTPPRARATP